VELKKKPEGGGVVVKQNVGTYDSNGSESHEHQLFQEMRSSYLPQPSFDFQSWSRRNETAYLFLHVGKAAGSTIYCMLTLPRIDENLEQNFWCPGLMDKAKETKRKNPIPPLYSQKYGQRLHMTKITHMELKYPYDVFLVGLRNPLSRFLSAYEYEKKIGNKWVQKTYPIFKRCFPNSVSAQNFLLNLGGNEANTVDHRMNMTSYCRKIAVDVTKGLVSSYKSHMTYNYQFYEDQFLTAINSTNEHIVSAGHVVAIRSEHLNEDFKNLEIFLRNGEVAVVPNNAKQDTITNIAMNVHKNGTLESILPNPLRVLCRVLCKEIQAYKRFLFRAENLNEEMIIDSIQNLKKYCPMETIKVQEVCEEISSLT